MLTTIALIVSVLCNIVVAICYVRLNKRLHTTRRQLAANYKMQQSSVYGRVPVMDVNTLYPTPYDVTTMPTYDGLDTLGEWRRHIQYQSRFIPAILFEDESDNKEGDKNE